MYSTMYNIIHWYKLNIVDIKPLLVIYYVYVHMTRHVVYLAYYMSYTKHSIRLIYIIQYVYVIILEIITSAH